MALMVRTKLVVGSVGDAGSVQPRIVPNKETLFSNLEGHIEWDQSKFGLLTSPGRGLYIYYIFIAPRNAAEFFCDICVCICMLVGVERHASHIHICIEVLFMVLICLVTLSRKNPSLVSFQHFSKLAWPVIKKIMDENLSYSYTFISMKMTEHGVNYSQKAGINPMEGILILVKVFILSRFISP